MATRQACKSWTLALSRSHNICRPTRPFTDPLTSNVLSPLRRSSLVYFSLLSDSRMMSVSSRTESRTQAAQPPFATPKGSDTVNVESSSILNAATKRRPKNDGKKAGTSYEGSSAGAKLEALARAKNRVALLLNSKLENPEEVQEAQQSLSRAFSQAIKHVAKAKLEKSALHAHQLLYEAHSHFCGIPIIPADMERADTMTNKEKGRLVGKILAHGSSSNDKSLLLMPTAKDYYNVFQSLASSKARKKGLYAEALLLQMIGWHLDGKGSSPDSKCFALTVKAIAGSTHDRSFLKICHLHDLHEAYLKCGTVGFVRDDPFFLLHSVKSISHCDQDQEREVVETWLKRLHSFVTNPVNASYVYGCFDRKVAQVDNGDEGHDDVENGEGRHIDTEPLLIDLTGTYTALIREYARLGIKQDTAAKARHVLDLMHEIAALKSDKETADSVCLAIATVDIKVNVYNLVLGAYNNSKKEKNTKLALKLLERMLGSWKKKDDAVPYPNEQSFVYCIQALSYLKDVAFAHKESLRLLKELRAIYVENDALSKSDFTSVPYNACMQLYTSDIGTNNKSSPKFLSMCSKLIDEMKEMALEFPNVTPNVTTWEYMLKAYAYSSSDKGKVLKRATQIFKQLEEEEKVFSKGEAAKKMTDKIYFYMMKCVANLMEDPSEEKHVRMAQLFGDARDKGLVSANVLKVFKSQVSEEAYLDKVGSGRLADKWVANVTSPKVLYTDGTMGGIGKNALRKAISTSDWLMKQYKRHRKVGTMPKKGLVKKSEKTSSFKIGSKNEGKSKRQF